MSTDNRPELLLELPVQLTQQDYIDANLLYRKSHGSPRARKTFWLAVLAATAGMAACVVLSALAGAVETAIQLAWLCGVFCVFTVLFLLLDRVLFCKRAARVYQNSRLLSQPRAVCFFQDGLSAVSASGRSMSSWEELDGAAENKWGLVLYRENVMFAVPGRVLDQGAADYLHRLLAFKLGSRYRVEQFVEPAGPVVAIPGERIQKDQPPPAVFFTVQAFGERPELRNSPKQQLLPAVAGSFLLFGIVCGAAFALGLRWSIIWGSAVSGAVLFLMGWMVPAMYRARRAAPKKIDSQTILRFSPTGFEHENKWEKAFVPWALVDSVCEAPSGFLVRYDACSQIWIEKDTLTIPGTNQSPAALAAELTQIFARYAPQGVLGNRKGE